jgi:ribokinase
MKKVIIAGSINMDIVATVKKHPVPGETLTGQDLNYYPGGKGANQAIAAAKMGAKTILIGHVGSDSAGEELIATLNKYGVHAEVEKIADTPTGTALIAVSSETSDNTIIVIPGANATLRPANLRHDLIDKGDILISQFEIPVETILAFFQAGRAKDTLNIFNAAPAMAINPDLYKEIDILIVNETELEMLSAMTVDVKNETSL